MLVAAPIAALVAVVFAGGPLLASYTQVFMPALGKFIVGFFPLFLAGAVFGKLMASTGYAMAIARWITGLIGARRAILATVLTGTVLTYGGISVFVVAFGLFPIAYELFRQADIPRRLIPAAIAMGAFTYAMSALPGSPQVQNTIPTRYFGTDAFAAPLLGVFAAVVMFAVGMAWLSFRARQAARRGEGFETTWTGGGMAGELRGEEDHLTEDTAHLEQESARAARTRHGRPDPPVALAAVPLLIVILVNLALSRWILPTLDFGYLAEEQWGATTLTSVIGLWSVFVALVTAVAFVLLVNLRRVRVLVEDLHQGAKDAVLPVFSTASEVGFGAVIASLPAYALVRDALLGVSSNPLVTASLATTSLAGITASASGGLSIALETLGADMLASAQAAGISPEALHRVASIASGGLDTLPHSGAVITLLLITGMSHRESYKDVAMVTVVGPLLATALVVVAAAAL